MAFEVVRNVTNTVAILRQGETGPAGSTTPADGTVTTPKIASQAVTTEKIDDNAITEAKIADEINYKVGDIELDAPTYGSGLVEGGVIRRATSMQIDWTYSQTEDPTDAAIGTAINVNWQADMVSTTNPWGPLVQTPYFGPRGVFNLEGTVTWSTNGSIYAMTPIAFANLLTNTNDLNSNRRISPSWGFMHSPLYIANGGTLKLSITDTNNGGAAFVDTASFLDWDGSAGTIDGVTDNFELVTLLSSPVMAANAGGTVHIANRIAVDIKDVGFGGLGTNTLDTNIGVRVRFLDSGTANIGILNESTTVNTPVVKTITAVGDSITPTSTIVRLNNTSGSTKTLTSTPTILDGQDGQELTLINSSANAVVIQSETSLAGSNSQSTITLNQYDTTKLVYSSTIGAWVVVGGTLSTKSFEAENNIARVTASSNGGEFGIYTTGQSYAKASLFTLPAFSLIGLGMGPGTSTYDAMLIYGGTASGMMKIIDNSANTGVLNAGRQHTLNNQTGTSYTLVLADRGKLITRTNTGASTQTYPQNSSVAFPIGTEIVTINLGSSAGAVTHQAGTGATVVGANVVQAIGTRMVATKTATNTWHIG